MKCGGVGNHLGAHAKSEQHKDKSGKLRMSVKASYQAKIAARYGTDA